MNAILRKIYYTMPVNLRYLSRKLLYLPVDILSRRQELVPPKGMIFTGRGDFLKSGETFFSHLLRHGEITPGSRVLDIGSGIGRMAVPFTRYLSEAGSYEGFDIVQSGVDWCNKNITAKFPNFNFRHTPLKNDLYNLSTNEKASKFTFPYESDTFDFAFLSSVFTHMMPEDVENYVSEIGRVLKSGKLCFATFFILDEESRENMVVRGSKSFDHSFGSYSLMDKNVKEANVAYEREYIFRLITSKGLKVEKFFRGSWSGAVSGELNEHQDIIIFRK